MSLKHRLSIPELSSSSIPVESSLKEVRKRLEQLPMLHTQKAAREITQDLADLNRHPLKPGIRLELLNEYNAYAWPLIESILTESFKHADHHNNDNNSLDALVTHFADGYKRALIDLDSQPVLIKKKSLLCKITISAIFSLTVSMLIHHIGRKKINNELLTEISVLYQYLADKNMNQQIETIHEHAPRLSGDHLLALTVLFLRTNPHELQSKQIWALYILLLTNQTLSIDPHEDNLHLPWHVNFSLEELENGFSKNSEANRKTSNIFCINAEEFSREISKKGLNNQYNVSLADWQYLTKRITRSWHGDQPNRIHERKQAARNCEATFDLRTLHALLLADNNASLQTDKKPASKNQIEITDLTRGFQTNETTSTQSLYTLRMVDISASGVGLESDTRMTNTFPGQFAAVKLTQKGLPFWAAGFVRWVVHSDEGSKIGIELVARDPDPVLVSSLAEKGRTDMAALSLPPNNVSPSGVRLITPPGVYQAGEHVSITMRDENKMAIMHELIESSASFQYFSTR